MSDAEALAETIEVVQGRRALDPRWQPLVHAFATEYRMRIVNVTTDDVEVGGSRGRLWLWAATGADYESFQNANSNYDSVKQARASELAPDGPWFVVCENYEREAFRAFVERGASPTRLEEARALLADDRVWAVNAALGRVVVFVHTDEERDALSNEERTAWEKTLWAWLSSLNPGGLARREQFTVEVDSKQTFDEKFEGSSYYYWL